MKRLNKARRRAFTSQSDADRFLALGRRNQAARAVAKRGDALSPRRQQRLTFDEHRQTGR